MPSIGDREIPLTNIESVLEAGKKIATQFKGQAFDRKALATALQFKSDKTGAFNQLLADLRKFGIVTGRGDMLQATDIVQRLAVPHNDQEYAGAVIEAMNNVPLFRELYHHYQGAVPAEDDLLATLINLTKEDRIKALGTVGRVRSNLAAGWAKGRTYQPAKAEVAAKPLLSPSRGGGTVPYSDLVTLVAGEIHLQYPLTENGIELMKLNFNGDGFWDLLKKQIKSPPARTIPSEAPK